MIMCVFTANLIDTDEMRAYHKMAIVKDDIFVIGGYNGNNNYHKNCRKFNLIKKTWSHVTPMNVERSYVSVAAIDRKIFAIGGYNGQFRLNTAEAFDLDTNQVRRWLSHRSVIIPVLSPLTTNIHTNVYDPTHPRSGPSSDRWSSSGAMPPAPF